MTCWPKHKRHARLYARTQTGDGMGNGGAFARAFAQCFTAATKTRTTKL